MLEPLTQILSWLIDPCNLLDQQRDAHGSTFRVNIGNDLKPIYIISDPDDIKKVFDPEYFDAPGTNSQVVEPIVGYSSILSLSGEKHQTFRRIYSKAISERLRDKEQIYLVIQKHYADIIHNLKIGDIISIDQVMRNITLRVILEIIFSIDVSCNNPFKNELKNSRIQSIFHQLMEQTVSPIIMMHLYFTFLQLDFGFFSPWSKYLKTIREVDSFIYESIEKNDTQKSDSLISLMSEYAESQKLTKIDIRNNLLTFLLAGYDTSSVVLSWFFAWNTSIPTIRESLLEEFHQYHSSELSKVIHENIYLDSLFNETLRLYPVAMILFPRVAKKDIHLPNIEIPNGSVVMVSPYLVHTNELIYPNARTFIPDRFVNSSFTQYEFLSFGGGSRYCLGSVLATIIIKSIIVLSSRTLELEPLSRDNIRPVRQGITSAPNISSYRIKNLTPL